MAPLGGGALPVNRCTLAATPRWPYLAPMDQDRLANGLTRAERALARIERAAQKARDGGQRDETLRAKVRDAIAQLDDLIHKAEA